MTRRHLCYSPDDAAGSAAPVTPAAVVAPPVTPSAEPERVPLTRLNEVIAEREAARTEAAAAKAANERALADLAKYASVESDLATARARLDLARSGVVDDDHAAALDQVYRSLPESERPKTPGELWQDIATGKRTPPRLLVGFMPTSTAAPVARPGLPASPSASPSAAGDVTAEQLRAANDAVRRNPRDPAAKAAADDLFARHKAQQSARRT